MAFRYCILLRAVQGHNTATRACVSLHESPESLPVKAVRVALLSSVLSQRLSEMQFVSLKEQIQGRDGSKEAFAVFRSGANSVWVKKKKWSVERLRSEAKLLYHKL